MTLNESRPYDTIILGAGMSGLSCAARLYQHDYFRRKNRLLVLEARQRIGGRIGSVNVKGNRLDTGANWIYGVGTAETPNPLMKVLPHKRYKQLSGTVVFQAPDHTATQADREEVHPQDIDNDWVHVSPQQDLQQIPEAKRHIVIPTDVAEVMLSSIWGMVGSLHETAEETPADSAKWMTMLQALVETDEFRHAHSAIPAEYHHTFGGMPQFLEGMEAAPLTAQSAEHAEGSPGMSLLEFGIDDFEGDQVFLQDGYTAVIEEVAKDLLEAGIVETGVEIKQIRWQEKPIVIETNSGTYSAKQVVCTLPLGVLKHDLNSKDSTICALFQPRLPAEKQEAIASLGFGTLDKIFLVYKDAWWETEPYTSIFKKGMVTRPFDSDGSHDHADSRNSPSTFDMLLAFTYELPGVEVHRDGSVSSGISTIMFVNHVDLTGFPVLSAFVSCSRAAQIEAMTNEQASGILHRALTRCLGREPPEPDDVYVTRWAQDEYSRGSYSHMITGLSEVKHREEFQRPISNKQGGLLRFAGEHTSKNHFATVHGAFISGRREAEDILHSLRETDQG